MRCGLALFQTRLSPLQQVAKRNFFVRSAAMSEDYSNRWEKQFWGKEGGLQQGEVRPMPPLQPGGSTPTAAPRLCSLPPPPPAGFWNAG